ncbi:MAG: Holliday junction branch migration protein RuvA [Planctomycetes bacterium]|nr:Holliday junction branch migration protein RuvA [Planctomycetota bacterium]
MYDYITGQVIEKKPDHVVIDAGGVGYRLEIPLSTYEKLPRQGTVKVYAYLKVAEDEHKLYGFATERERETFLRLINHVSGLGPSKAVAILSGVGVEELSRAIDEGNAVFLKRVKGIGDKLANRLIVELKGKLPEAGAAGKGPEGTSLMKDAVQALVALGYDRAEADEAVRRAQKDLPPEAPVEELIRRSLANV